MNWHRLDSIWLARDADAFSRLFEENVSFVFVDRGVALETRLVVRRHFTDQFAQQSPELRHASTVRHAKLLAPGVISADVDIDVRRDGTATPLRRFAAVAVMRQSGDGWLIDVLRVFTLPLPTGGS